MSAAQFIDARHRESVVAPPWLHGGPPYGGPAWNGPSAGNKVVVGPSVVPNTPDAFLDPGAGLPTPTPAVYVAQNPTFADARHRETLTNLSWMRGPQPSTIALLPPSRGSSAVSAPLPGDDGVSILVAGIADTRLPVMNPLVVPFTPQVDQAPYTFAGAEGIPPVQPVTGYSLGRQVIANHIEGETVLPAWLGSPPGPPPIAVNRTSFGSGVVVPFTPQVDQPPFVYMFEGGPYYAELQFSFGSILMARPNEGDWFGAPTAFMGSSPVGPFISGFVPLQTAISILVNAGLMIHPVIVYKSDPIIPLGYVIAQNPPAGSVVTQWTYVQLTVSTGPANIQGTTVVPNVVGLDRYVAQAALTAADLTFAPVTYVPDTSVAGTVLAQSPFGGSVSPVGGTVYLTVSTGQVPATVTVVVPLVH